MRTPARTSQAAMPRLLSTNDSNWETRIAWFVFGTEVHDALRCTTPSVRQKGNLAPCLLARGLNASSLAFGRSSGACSRKGNDAPSRPTSIPCACARRIRWRSRMLSAACMVPTANKHLYGTEFAAWPEATPLRQGGFTSLLWAGFFADGSPSASTTSWTYTDVGIVSAHGRLVHSRILSIRLAPWSHNLASAAWPM